MLVRRRLAAAFVGEIELPRRDRARASNCLSATGSAISGSRVRPHCSAASIAIACSRSSLTRSATVRWVMTGISRAAPSSVAFSTSQSVCARFTGAKASQTSGIALRVARAALDGQASFASCRPRRSAPAIRRTGRRTPAARRRRQAASHCRDNWPDAASSSTRRALGQRFPHEQARQALGGQAGVAGMAHAYVIPAKAGIPLVDEDSGTPAFAGVTREARRGP